MQQLFAFRFSLSFFKIVVDGGHRLIFDWSMTHPPNLAAAKVYLH